MVFLFSLVNFSGEKRGLPFSESQIDEDRPDSGKKKKKKHKKSLLS